MDKKIIRELLPEPLPNKEQKADWTSFRPAIAKPHVVRCIVWVVYSFGYILSTKLIINLMNTLKICFNFQMLVLSIMGIALGLFFVIIFIFLDD